jgi:predicted 3-demethylubiquinone-9 3-methyltransferase (glyoxalase superfamily)
MSEIVTFLTFNDQAESAARFYTSIFPGSRITRISRYPDIEGLPPAGSVMTVEFQLMGQPFVALNGGPEFSFSQGISISIQCDTQQEVDEYWARLTDGGRGVACGWLIDRFGISWQINPKLLMELTTSDDPATAKKAMLAMMEMVKIDSDALRRATRS